MKFIFENDLPHQRAAIDAALGVFGDATEGSKATFTVAPLEIAGQLELAEKGVGIGNVCAFEGEDWLANIQAVQLANALEPDGHFQAPDFTIEMETGTGKTYVYLRTIIELNRKNGFTKFVIVVPSVAIREGVKKSIEQTREHFASQFDGLRLNEFVYDRNKLGRVREFATAADIQVMIVTIQSINSANNVFYDPNQEALGDQAAAEWVAKTRPVLIVDEPQSVEGGLKGAGRQALAAMNPLAQFKYTATPVNPVHTLFRLDAFDAFQLGLVKRIWVDGASVRDAANGPYVRLIDTEAKKGQAPRARIEIHKQFAAGPKPEQVWAYDGDTLQDLSGGRAVYAGLEIGNIDAAAKTMQLMLPGDIRTMERGEVHGDNAGDTLTTAMIARTIEHHFRTELRNRPLGIKTLSLFFVPSVSDYRLYTPDGPKNGPLADVFEREYRKLAARPEFRTLFVNTPADPVRAHGGYFSQDKHSVTPFEDKEFSKSTKDEKVEERTFDLIMRDKEKLLDEAEPLRFLFSHSALREGWDNPNVFQICALREMGSERSRRQSIGRGLRLPVDEHGLRRRDEGIARLTVIADTDYATFADELQTELEKETKRPFGRASIEVLAKLYYPVAGENEPHVLGVEDARAVFAEWEQAGLVDNLGRVTDAMRQAVASVSVPLPATLGPEARLAVAALAERLTAKLIHNTESKIQVERREELIASDAFRALWAKVSARTRYKLTFTDGDLISKAVEYLQQMPDPAVARVTWASAELIVARDGVETGKKTTAPPRKIGTFTGPMPDILSELAARTDLPRSVIARILVQADRLQWAKDNPSAFVELAHKAITLARRDILTVGITYERTGDHFDQSLFSPFEADEADLVPVDNAPTTHIRVDSSTIERPIAAELDVAEPVTLFAKLPPEFKIDTPLGTYNPDWAVSGRADGGPVVHLVSESKSDFAKLRDDEKAKVRCGAAHFEALGIPYVKAVAAEDIVLRLLGE
ncbi:DEAD/DEAH box helicase family protein [Sphingomonas sp. LHG3406-1]|uniref:restriction endonuclease n=1 Tax=Sphingomonas sp. LHG3406-1 TaxID=2804617 RepID=UPI002619F31E|nr:DEAD/DEAH box helicase family protein [Sphingomonas sp. LHG3406-1]